MELWQLFLIAFGAQGIAVWLAGKFLAWVGEIPRFSVRTLIRNKGWAVWYDQPPKRK